jgi:type I restriction enzyme M protein
MYLHGFQNPQIHEYDSLTSEKHWDETFDVIMANPPFMTPKGGIVPHKRFSIQSKKAEALFVDYIVEHLSIKGKAGIVVPDGIVANPSSLYIKLRKLAVENGLYAVVSLHNMVFKPYAGAKTSILFFDKEFAKRNNKIIFAKLNNDGFEKGEQRRKIEIDDIPKIKLLLADFKTGSENIKSDIDFVILKKENLTEKCSLFVNKYLIANRENENETKQISELFDIEKGSLQSTKKTEGEFNFITAAQEWSKHNEYTHDCEALLFAFGAAGSLGRTHYVTGKFIASDLVFILTPKKDSEFPINLEFYHAYFNSVREQIVGDLAKGVSKLAINKTDFSNYFIDYTPIEKQNEIGLSIADEKKNIAEIKNKIIEAEENIKETIFEIL